MSRRNKERQRKRSRSRSPQWEHRRDDHDEEELTVSDKVAMFEEELDFLEGKNERRSSKADLYCNICDVYTSGITMLQKHFGGAKHRKNLAKRGLTGDFDELVKPPSDERISNVIVKCVLCNVILQGSEIDIHSNAEKHLEMISKIQVEEADLKQADLKRAEMETQWYIPVVTCDDIKPNKSPASDPVNGPFECKLCSLVLPTKDSLDLHVNGKKHQKKLRWKHVFEGDNGFQAQYWCSICGIFCTQRQGLDQHFAGKLHAKMLRSKGVSENEINLGLESNTKVLENDIPLDIKLEDTLFDQPSSSKLLGSQSPLDQPLLPKFGPVLPPHFTQSLSSGSCVASSLGPANTSSSGKPHSDSKSQESSYKQDSINKCDNKPSVGSSIKQPNLLSVGWFLQSLQPSCNNVTIKTEPKLEDDE